MSVGPLGMIGSLAGTPLAQTKGAEVDRAQQDTASQSRQASSADKAEAAAGIGTTEEDQQADERDADGRRLWEAPAEAAARDAEPSAPPAAGVSRDATGLKGNVLDISG